jgi:hypothetical protein
LPEIESPKPKSRLRFSSPVLIVVGLAVVGMVAGWYWFLREGPPAPEKPVLTAEAKAYVRHLRLSEVDMKAKQSYFRQEVVEIVGKISNDGNRPLKLLEINCVFQNPYGQVVLRERVAIVSQRMGGLSPGETKSFRLPFDNLPESWNQVLPQLVIARIVFG